MKVKGCICIEKTTVSKYFLLRENLRPCTELAIHNEINLILSPEPINIL